jgi:hypothetical protein
LKRSKIYCPSRECPDHEKVLSGGQPRVVKFGRTRAGVQRYRCSTCHRTFTETNGTMVFRRRTPEHEILETLASLAKGSRLGPLARKRGYKEDTIVAWLREAALYADDVDAVLMRDYQVEREQMDALWAYVRRRVKRDARRREGEASLTPSREEASVVEG